MRLTESEFGTSLACRDKQQAARLSIPLGFWVFPGEHQSGRFFFIPMRSAVI